MIKKILTWFWCVAIAMIVISCSSGPTDTFDKMKKAACENKVEEFVSYFDIDSMLVIAKEQGFTGSAEEMKNILIHESQREWIQSFCNFSRYNTEGNGDIKYLFVKKNPYIKQKYKFKKIGDIWKYAGLGDPIDPPLKISAPELNQAFVNNQIQAESNYKGKVLSVTGVVRNIQKDITDRYPLITIGTGLVGDVTCQLMKEYEAQAANLKKGDEVTITGICEGYLILVQMEDCII